MTQKIKLEFTPEEAALVHRSLNKSMVALDNWKMCSEIMTRIRVVECDAFVEAARARDNALPVQHTRGRSKLFKS